MRGNRQWKPRRRERRYIPTPGIVRCILAVVGSLIFLIAPVATAHGIAVAAAGAAAALSLPLAGMGVIGGILGIWKRKLGGWLMVLAGLFSLWLVIGSGLWGLLGSGLVIGCGVSSLWGYIR